MTEKTKELTITEQIDIDEGLKTKRKLLTVTSLILLALSFSGAKVEEANTFILKLSFENQKGLSVLLVIAVIFLLIRYYNYACKYHQQLYKLWSDRLINDDFFIYSHPYEQEYSGIIFDLQPKGFNVDEVRQDGGAWGFRYECRWLFLRKINYWWHDRHAEHDISVRVGWRNYFKVLVLESRYQFMGFFSHRENLDIVAPYVLGILAISSFVFDDQFQYVLNIITKN
jgi:hypothetical protein